MPAPKSPKLKTPPDEGSAPYEVGYKKPPEGTRFQPKCSGNPKGRPKGSRNKGQTGIERLREIIRQEAYREITVNDGGRELKIPLAQAVVRTMGMNAAKGQIRHTELFTRSLNETELADKRRHDELLQAACEYKAWWQRELDYRARYGTSGPEPLPHPDHIIIDLRAGTVEFRGPMTKEELKQYEALWDIIRAGDAIIKKYEEELESGPRKKRREHLIMLVSNLQARRQAFASVVGEPPCLEKASRPS